MSEEKKYKINVNRPELKKDEIKKYRDFRSIVSMHNDITKRPIYKRKKVFFFILLLLIVAYLLYLSEREEELIQQEKTEQTEK